MAIRTYQIVGSAAAGGAGVATATDQTNAVIPGRLVGVDVKYQDAPPATTDLTIRTKGSDNKVSRDLLVRTNVNTDGHFEPVTLVQDSTGADIAGQYAAPAINDVIEVIIAQANDGDSVIVTLYVDY